MILNNMKDIRWEQRFENFEKAYLFFEKNLKRDNFSLLEELWLLQSFEFTFELSWKTMKDYLSFNWVDVKSPREAIKEAYSMWIIDNADIWLEMLVKRNELTHIYDEWLIDWSIDLIKWKYFINIKKVFIFLKTKLND